MFIYIYIRKYKQALNDAYGTVRYLELNPGLVYTLYIWIHVYIYIYIRTYTQALNDAYGTARYLEINPGTFYPVTYAFLFGIMFGDIGIVCCSVLRCVAVCCSVLQCVAMGCNGLQWVAVCCSVLQCVAVCCSVLQCAAACCSVLLCVAVCCSVLQCTWYYKRAQRPIWTEDVSLSLHLSAHCLCGGLGSVSWV